jgi:hypothetical protein
LRSAARCRLFAGLCEWLAPRPPHLVRKLTPADSDDLAAALAFALRFEGRKRQHDADAFMADIVAKRLVRYLERALYVVMKRPLLGGHSAVGRGFAQRD